MKKLVLALITTLFCLPALANVNQCQLVVHVTPGVTQDQLSTQHLQRIADKVYSCYFDMIKSADAKYNQAVAAVGTDPADDHSGDILNGQLDAANKAHEKAYCDAGFDAAAYGDRLCKGLCTWTFCGDQAPGQGPGWGPKPTPTQAPVPQDPGQTVPSSPAPAPATAPLL